jgi:hypothetical protein
MSGAPGFAFEEDRPGWTLVEVTDKQLLLRYKPLGAEGCIVKELEVS